MNPISCNERRVFAFWRWPEEDAGETVQFRLIYKGPLPSQRSGGKGGSLSRDKHSIRRQLHPQLKELWDKRHHLKFTLEHRTTKHSSGDRQAYKSANSDAMRIADKYIEGEFRFLPLITPENGLACKLDILFLRRDAPGSLIENGGDLDNRIKVLLDALKVPNRGTMVNVLPEEGENPLYCLLSDDRLITDISVVTDRLLMPLESRDRIHDVFLVIQVTVKVIEANEDNMDFLGE